VNTDPASDESSSTESSSGSSEENASFTMMLDSESATKKRMVRIACRVCSERKYKNLYYHERIMKTRELEKKDLKDQMLDKR